MNIINLDPNFQPYGPGIDFKEFIFPSGCEVHIKLPAIEEKTVFITTRIKSSDDIMKLLMATDALKRSGVKEIYLFMPYLPYARQDRQMIKGEPLSLKVFADLLNSQNYSKVNLYDVHSEVALALINNSAVTTNHNLVSHVLENEKDYYIVSPDAGAYKKIFKVCQHIKYDGEIQNNNCWNTGCVQGGIGYWQKIQRDDIEKFDRMAKVEHELTDLKGEPVTMLKDQSKGGGLVFLKPHPKYPGMKDISMMKGREPKPLFECNGFCGTNDLIRNETEKEINYQET